MRTKSSLLVISFMLVVARAAAASEPVFSSSGPDAPAYGEAEGYPVPKQGREIRQQDMVGMFSRYETLLPVRMVARSPQPSMLRRAAREIKPVYHYDSRQNTIADYLGRTPATGLLIARGDTILFEHYRYGRTDKDRFLTHSVIKTVTAMLLGIAIAEGSVRSVDDAAEAYVPELAGTEYGATPLRALLHMTSGVAFSEDYGPNDDLRKLHADLIGPKAIGAVAALKRLDFRMADPGTRFAYASAETEVLGLVIARAVKMPLAEYLRSRIWQKLGAESDGAWAVDPTGQELAYCCFAAVLRDWARLGLMLAHDGAWNGQQIVPKQWVLDATTIRPGEDHLRNTIAPSWGYGYQVWILPGERRMFVLLGIHGQDIFVDPESKLVMVQSAVRTIAAGDPRAAEIMALWYALVAQYGLR